MFQLNCVVIDCATKQSEEDWANCIFYRLKDQSVLNENDSYSDATDKKKKEVRDSPSIKGKTPVNEDSHSKQNNSQSLSKNTSYSKQNTMSFQSNIKGIPRVLSESVMSFKNDNPMTETQLRILQRTGSMFRKLPGIIILDNIASISEECQAYMLKALLRKQFVDNGVVYSFPRVFSIIGLDTMENTRSLSSLLVILVNPFNCSGIHSLSMIMFIT
jgi:hypothetical protein